jgi:hypothetical protein
VRFVVDKVALGQIFSGYFGFSCPFTFHQMLHTCLSSWTGTIGQLVADVPSGLSFTPLNEIKNIEGKIDLYNSTPDILKFFLLLMGWD